MPTAWKSSRVNLAFSKLEDDSAAIGAATIFLQKIFKEDRMKMLNYFTSPSALPG